MGSPLRGDIGICPNNWVFSHTHTNHSSFCVVCCDRSGPSCLSLPGTKWDGLWPSAICVLCDGTRMVPQGDASFPTTARWCARGLTYYFRRRSSCDCDGLSASMIRSYRSIVALQKICYVFFLILRIFFLHLTLHGIISRMPCASTTQTYGNANNTSTND